MARVIAFDGPKRPRLDPERIVGRAASRIRFGLQPYITLLELHYPIDELCRRLKRKVAAPASNAMSGSAHRRRILITAKASAAPIYLAVHRLDFSVYTARRHKL